MSMTVDGELADISECELRKIYTYEVFDDSLVYRVNSDPEFCENGPVEISQGEWSVLTLPTNNQVANRIQIIQGSDTLIKEIREITSLFITLQSSPGGESIVEAFEAVNRK